MVCNVTHLITGLGKGGAETMLYQVLKHKTDLNITYRVISMGGSHYYEDLIRLLGVEVIEVQFKRQPMSSLIKITQFLKQTKTDTLCCWMYHANFIGYITGRMAKVNKIVWNIRHSDLSTDLNKGTTLIINKICARWSQNIDAIAYNGVKARETHETVGYCQDNGLVLDNGVDINEFKVLPGARAKILKELGLDDRKKIILSVTRYHIIKDIPTFVKAFSSVHCEMPDTVAVMCGNGIEDGNEELVNFCRSQGLSIGQDLFLLGLRHDIPVLMSAADLYVLHSASEAFPNTLVQAMGCGCICLTTDVGDAAKIICNPKRTVKPGDVDALSITMLKLLSQTSEATAIEATSNRKRVLSVYSIESVVRSYERLYE